MMEKSSESFEASIKGERVLPSTPFHTHQHSPSDKQSGILFSPDPVFHLSRFFNLSKGHAHNCESLSRESLRGKQLKRIKLKRPLKVMLTYEPASENSL